MTSKPLAGRTILVTRPKARARELSAGLAAAGARVVAAPAIRFGPPGSFAALDAALRGLAAYDAVAFSSATAVDVFFSRARRLGLDRPDRPPRLYAIGPETAKRLRRFGWGAARVPRTHRAEALARAMGPVRGRRILIPRAEVAREELPRLLRRRGARVDAVAAYRTRPDPAILRRLKASAGRGAIDAVTFTSASTVDALVSGLGAPACRRLFRSAAAASIGPVTSAALKARGIRPDIQALTATSRGLLEGLKAYFRAGRRGRR